MIFANNKGKKIIIGMVHLMPFPGTPQYEEGNIEKLEEKVLKDAIAIKEGGAHGCLLQTEDWVYDENDETDPIRVASMANLVSLVRHEVGPDFIIGCQLLWNCMTPSLAVAKACNANFIRGTVFMGSANTAYGVIKGNPLKVMTYRKLIDAKNIDILSEVSGYHHDLEYSKENVQFMAFESIRMGADALEVCDRDEAKNRQICLDIKEKGDYPIILGGATDIENCVRRLEFADAALVGNAFEGGNWGGNIVKECVERYMDNVSKAYDINVKIR